MSSAQRFISGAVLAALYANGSDGSNGSDSSTQTDLNVVKNTAKNNINKLVNLTNSEKQEAKDAIDNATTVEDVYAIVNTDSQNKLPNTGEQENNLLTIVGVLLLGVLSLFGFNRRKKN